MGNWMLVNMIGRCKSKDVESLRKATYCDSDFTNFGPLCWMDQPSLCGLGKWPNEEISAIGNVAERDYDASSVATHLRKLVQAAPSLSLKVHCGGDYEDKKCVATVTVKNGSVEVGPPEIEILHSPSQEQIAGNLFAALRMGQ